jgi:tetratricopeptide (TPR) repeat protein
VKTVRAAFILVMVFVVGGMQSASADGWAAEAAKASSAQKTGAQTKLEAGNQLFLKQQYKEALDAYEAAIKSWDHPAIRFNIVRCLIQLDRPVEATDNLALALKYGAEPLEEAVYNEALNYQKLLAKQIGNLEVTCSQQGAKVTLDGQPLMDCPGSQKRRVAPGAHGVVATKEGFLTKEMRVSVVGGTDEKVDIKLVPLDKAAKVVHKWPTWIPWVVFGGGLTLATFGALIQFEASSKMNDYDQGVGSLCMVTGCNPSMPKNQAEQDLVALKSSAENYNKVGVTVISVGVAGAVAGGIMLFMNRGKTVYEEPMKPGAPQVGVVPMRDGGGLMTVSGRF